MKVWNDIFVFIEQAEGNVTPMGYQLLGEARRLALVSNRRVCAVLLEDNQDNVLNKLIHYGADEVYILYSNEKVVFGEDIAIQLIEDFVNGKNPEIFLFGGTVAGRAIASGLAGRLQTGLTADCTELQIKDGILLQRRPAYEGDKYATIICRQKRPQMATIRPGIMKAIQEDIRRTGVIHRYKVQGAIKKSYEVIWRDPLKKSNGELAKAKIVVAIGMGIANEKNIRILQEQAQKIGAAIGATRPVVDSGLLSSQYQIGLTGASIQPDLYIACGIAGSAQHMSGLAAKNIIAVNTDKNAPIFHAAQYGIVDDAMAVVPQLFEELANKKQKTSVG